MMSENEKAYEARGANHSQPVCRLYRVFSVFIYNRGNKFRGLFKESIEFYHSLKPVFKILSSNEHLP